ncbi:MAG TPA: type IV secretion system DNA-binding domain-containing protein [Candidatus Saccharimonadales bacterium]|nr:type IV secretion system DNA-binding domain-containing protein [Candidatus Saccharimonadales bacterium]
MLVIGGILVIVIIAFFWAYRSALSQEKGDSKKEAIGEGVLLSIRLPKENEKLPIAAEQMFASLHGLLRFTPDLQEHISLEMASSSSGINFYCFTPRGFKSFVESQIYAQYPDAEIREAVDYSKSVSDNAVVIGTELALAKDFIFPIKTFRDFEVDPLAAITSALGSVRKTEQIWVQIMVRPIDDFWQDRGHDYVKMVREGKHPVSLAPGDIAIDVGKHILSVGTNILPYMMSGPKEPPLPARAELAPRLSAGQELDLKMIENKLSKIGFETKIRVVAVADTKEEAQAKLSSAIASFKQFSTASLNAFEPDPDSPTTASMVKSYRDRSFPEGASGDYVLTIEELASIFHLPNLSVETPTIAWTHSKKGEPPLNIPTSAVTYLGKTYFRDHEQTFGIKKPDRRKHMYIIGKTGTGKSTLIKNMIIQDMRNGEGVAVLDPHGQLIDELLEFVPENRAEDVVIFNPADADHPVSLNMLEMVDPRQRTLMADTLVDVFKKYFANSWGPRLEYILKNCILTLLEVPNTSLLSITRLLVDKGYRRYIVGLIKDPQMKDFWLTEFAKLEQNDRLITEAIAPIQNKVGQFLNSELIRNIVGQPKSTIKVDDIINNKKLFFVNLASGRIGANNTSLLGAMIVSQLEFAAMRRVDIPEESRQDFFLYADEFQNFATDSFAVILSEARKYRLDLVITHQYIEQMPETVRDAIFGNVGTTIVFGVGNQDAHFLEREFSPVFLENDFINLGRFEMYIKLQIDDQGSKPFSAVSLAPPTDATAMTTKAIQLSRIKFGKEVEKVEKLIKKWTETKFIPGQPPQPPAWAVEEARAAAAAAATPAPARTTPAFGQPATSGGSPLADLLVEESLKAPVSAPTPPTFVPEALQQPQSTPAPQTPVAAPIPAPETTQPQIQTPQAPPQPSAISLNSVDTAFLPPKDNVDLNKNIPVVESFEELNQNLEGTESYPDPGAISRQEQEQAKITPENLNQNLPTGLVGGQNEEKKEPAIAGKSGEVEIFRFPPTQLKQ